MIHTASSDAIAVTPNKSSLLRNTDRFKQSQKSSFLSLSLIPLCPSLLTLVTSFPLARKALKESATHFFELCLENQPLCTILNPYTVLMLHAYCIQTLTEYLNFFIHQRRCMTESYISLEREIRLLIEQTGLMGRRNVALLSKCCALQGRISSSCPYYSQPGSNSLCFGQFFS